MNLQEALGPEKVLGNLMIFASMFRSTMASLAETVVGEDDTKHT